MVKSYPYFLVSSSYKREQFVKQLASAGKPLGLFSQANQLREWHGLRNGMKNFDEIPRKSLITVVTKTTNQKACPVSWCREGQCCHDAALCGHTQPVVRTHRGVCCSAGRCWNAELLSDTFCSEVFTNRTVFGCFRSICFVEGTAAQILELFILFWPMLFSVL